MDLTPKKLVESGSRCFICSSDTIAKDKIYIGKNSLDIAEKIVNDLIMTGLHRLPLWFPNFHSSKHIFERFTVDLSLGTYFDSANSNNCQMIYLLFHEAYQRRRNNGQ